MANKRKPITAQGQSRVSAKISKLHKAEPGKTHAQKVAMAINMEKQHSLGPKGGYRRKRRAKQ